MPPVLRALPYFAHSTEVFMRDERVEVRAYQIIVWVGIAGVGEFQPAPDAPRFPAILDTGHNHMFAIRPTQLREWAGVEWHLLPTEFGHQPKYNGVPVPHRRANLWLYPNQYGWRDFLDPHTPPALLELNEGVAVYGDGEWLGTGGSEKLAGPRLPLIGLRAVTSARLGLRIDADAQRVWIDAPDVPAGVTRALHGSA